LIDDGTGVNVNEAEELNAETNRVLVAVPAIVERLND
jgi:hypothetical protein